MLTQDDTLPDNQSVSSREGALAGVQAVRSELSKGDAGLLRVLLWLALIMTILAQSAEVLTQGANWRMIPGMISGSFMVVGLALVKKPRYFRFVAHTFIATMWLSTAIPLPFYGGVKGSIGAAFTGIVIVAVSVVGRRAGFVAAGISTAYFFAVYLAQRFEVLPPPEPIAPEGDLITLAGMAIAAAIVVGHALSRADGLVRSLFTAADELESVIEERTRNLQALNAQLIDENMRRKATEAELLRARNQAEAAAEVRTTFLANMSHEIRTPMNAVVAGASLLENAELPEDTHELAQAVSSGAKSLLGVVNDVLDLNKLEAGAVQLVPVTCRPKDVVEEVRRLFLPLAQEKDLELAVVMDASMDAAVKVDEPRLRQVLTNLVGNAVKFTESGYVRVHASVVSTGEGDANIRVDVEDTGPGIPPGDQDSVFDAFTQADPSLSRRHAGSGLGLAISRELVELMGGDLGVSSEPGDGATFSFWVPVTKGGAAEATRASLSSDLSGLRVLVAEDTELNRMLTRRYLEMLGVEPDLAQDGAEALEAAKHEAYDLVLMDLHMPVMDGFEAARRIRKEGRGKPRIIAFTADMMSDAELEKRSADIDGLLSKPMTEDALRRALVACRE